MNSLIREALIEGRSAENKYEKDGYAVKWTFVNDLELIFVVSSSPKLISLPGPLIYVTQVAYQRILQLTYVDDLLAALKTLFVQMFKPFLTGFVESLHAVSGTVVNAAAAGKAAATWDFTRAFEKWDSVFDSILRELEGKATQVRG